MSAQTQSHFDAQYDQLLDAATTEDLLCRLENKGKVREAFYEWLREQYGSDQYRYKAAVQAEFIASLQGSPLWQQARERALRAMVEGWL